MTVRSKEITELILNASTKGRRGARSEEPTRTRKLDWPLQCTVGPGLEGAIACESGVGYINGSRGEMIYRGYDIFDLCAYSTFEEVSYLLLNGQLPTETQLASFNEKLVRYRCLPNTLRRLMSFPLETMHPTAALRLGANLMRHRLTWRDIDSAHPTSENAIAADEDSIPMETRPMGEKHAIYEFRHRKVERPPDAHRVTDDASSMEACLRLIAGMGTLAAAIARLRDEQLPIEPDLELSHAANFLYMMTGRKPTREEERIMDVCLILHADHGMNASTFASLVVASTLSDIYLSVGSGIAALSGPLHGGANEAVVDMLEGIGSPDAVEEWYSRMRKRKERITGFGHRVYKAYDPRARILAPLARLLVQKRPDMLPIYRTARKLDKLVTSTLGKEKGIFPNVDFYSGLVYRGMGIPKEMFTPIFAVSRVAGWTARILEYLQRNRIFRPRAIYTGEFGKKYVPVGRR